MSSVATTRRRDDATTRDGSLKLGNLTVPEENLVVLAGLCDDG
jgi:hypothetical protein